MNHLFLTILTVLNLTIIMSCGGGGSSVSPPENENLPNHDDENPSFPVWMNDEIGVISVEPSSNALTIMYGEASDPDGDNPVSYNICFIDVTSTGICDPFCKKASVREINGKPYNLTNLTNEHKYRLAIRAVDFKGREESNEKKLYGTPHDPSNHSVNLTRVTDKLSTLKTICYMPTNCNPETGIFPDEESIKADLEALYDIGFRGIVTFGAYGIFQKIPRIAKEQVGFELVIMGIWNPNSDSEKTCAKSEWLFVDGYCIGNEGLNKRYTYEQLKIALSNVRSVTHRPVTTTETWDNYSQEVKNVVDWLFPNAHPYWHNIKDGVSAAQWVADTYNSFNKSGKFLCFKETGMPTGGDTGLSVENTKTFFEELHKTSAYFVYFEAFDQPWKNWAPVEPYWGLFDSNRNFKLPNP